MGLLGWFVEVVGVVVVVWRKCLGLFGGFVETVWRKWVVCRSILEKVVCVVGIVGVAMSSSL